MMRHLRNKFGLRLKVTWVGLSGTILALSMATAAVMFQIRWLITYEQGEAARMIAQGIGDAAELALAVRDQSELERLADGFMRNKQVLFIALYDKAGKCLARSVRDAALLLGIMSGKDPRDPASMAIAGIQYRWHIPALKLTSI